MPGDASDSASGGSGGAGETGGIAEETLTADVPVDATGVTALGTPGFGDGEVVDVRAESAQTDHEFTVTFGGDPLYADAQSLAQANTEETFDPTQNATGSGEVAVDITAASATGGATMTVTVTVENR